MCDDSRELGWSGEYFACDDAFGWAGDAVRLERVHYFAGHRDSDSSFALEHVGMSVEPN